MAAIVIAAPRLSFRYSVRIAGADFDARIDVPLWNTAICLFCPSEDRSILMPLRPVLWHALQ